LVVPSSLLLLLLLTLLLQRLELFFLMTASEHSVWEKVLRVSQRHPLPVVVVVVCLWVVVGPVVEHRML
jgi:hypothetical protein